jgi:hypothetical protein
MVGHKILTALASVLALVCCPGFGDAAWARTAVIQVPKRDSDGNAMGGVRLPDIAVPLGVNARQNPPLSRCALAGAYVAFPRTAAEATGPASGLRPVLERYKERNVYVDQVRAAAGELAREGFLLPEDATIIIRAAAQSPLWQDDAPWGNRACRRGILPRVHPSSEAGCAAMTAEKADRGEMC